MATDVKPCKNMFVFPHPTGMYQVGTKEFRLVDEDRLDAAGANPYRETEQKTEQKRELMAQV